MSASIAVDVHILDKAYRVMCPETERDALLASARELDLRMRQIRDHNRIIGTERIAVIAALNIMHELLQAQGLQREIDHSLSERLNRIIRRLDEALGA